MKNKKQTITSVQVHIPSPAQILTVSYWKTFPALSPCFLRGYSLVMMHFSDPLGKMTPFKATALGGHHGHLNEGEVPRALASPTCSTWSSPGFPHP